MSNDLAGLREEDGPALLDTAEDRSARAWTEALPGRLAELSWQGRLPASPRRRRGWWVGLVAALWLAALIPPGLRSRGGEGFAGDVVLEAAAEGPQGLHRLAPGTVVAPEERVVLQVSASRAGSLCIVDDAGDVVFPVKGPWWVEAGTAVPGGTHALSWRPLAAGPVTLTVQLCSDASRTSCVQDSLSLDLR